MSKEVLKVAVSSDHRAISAKLADAAADGHQAVMAGEGNDPHGKI